MESMNMIERITQAETTVPPASQIIRDRRREKTQTSCSFCRRRKVRCDRQLPCRTCESKGLGLSCTYVPDEKDRGASSVKERIQQLEELVRSMAQQQANIAAIEEHSWPSRVVTPEEQIGSHVPKSALDCTFLPEASVLDQKQGFNAIREEPDIVQNHSPSTRYVGDVHWAAILDSISDLKNDYGEEQRKRIRDSKANALYPNALGPRILYEPIQVEKSDILSTLPPRPVVDRMLARYLNFQGITPAVIHNGQFLREYEAFWKEPLSASFIWIGLLFSILCLSTQHQQLNDDSQQPDAEMNVYIFRERVVHCLNLGRFSEGGDRVLETMINYCVSEALLCKDTDHGPWLVFSIIIQLALSQGYHRDPRHLPKISPFSGEMRRRIWSAITQMDLRLSSHLGLPRLIKSQQCDTAEPRNLFDSDFDESTTELPSSRPQTEITPMLFGLAKTRIDAIGGMISDVISDLKEHAHSEVIELDFKLQQAEASLPQMFHWQPISESLMMPPQVVFYRILLQLAVQRLRVWLHRKYLSSRYLDPEYQHSRKTCVQAAINILQFQQLIEDEVQPNGLLYSVQWMHSSLMHSIFLLGMSIACYYLQLEKSHPDMAVDERTGSTIRSLLQRTYRIWLRSSSVSYDALKAAQHLVWLAGIADEDCGAQHLDDYPFQDSEAAFDRVTWDAYHGIFEYDHSLELR